MSEITKHLKTIRHSIEAIEEILSGQPTPQKTNQTHSSQLDGQPMTNAMEMSGMKYEQAEELYGLPSMLKACADFAEDEKTKGFCTSLLAGFEKHGSLTDKQLEAFKKCWWHVMQKNH